MDCAPVEKVEMLPGPAMASMLSSPAQADALGAMLVTTRHGSVVVPGNFPRRESKDNQMHACMRPGQGGEHAPHLHLHAPGNLTAECLLAAIRIARSASHDGGEAATITAVDASG